MKSVKPVLLLAVVLLPSLVAFTVTFDKGQFAVYELLKMENEDSVYNLQGGQAFVRFARVLSAPMTYTFQTGKVALKIGSACKEGEMRREQKAHDFIRKNAPGGFIEGVVRAEIALGESVDLKNDTNLVLLDGEKKENKYFILVMELLGKDMDIMYKEKRGPLKKQLDKIYTSLCATLVQLKNIKMVHGDIKPQNIIFKSNNNFEDGVKLADLGLAIFEGSDLSGCAGDPIYVSPIQQIKQRLATHEDDAVSLAYSITHVATGYLPWMEYIKDLKLVKCKYKYQIERILVAKHEFNLNPFSTYSKEIRLSPLLEATITYAIKWVTSPEVAKVQDKIKFYKTLIERSEKNVGKWKPVPFKRSTSR